MHSKSYDTIFIPCPKCGTRYPAQSKSGDCLLKDYDLENTPPDVLVDVNRHAPFECECGCKFVVELVERRVIVHLPIVKELK